MVRIRLRRTGAKNNPAYRIVVADQRAPRDGAFIETLGHYLPTRQPHVVEIDDAKAREWLGKGAQPSETVASLLRQKGIFDSNNKVTPEGTPAPEPKAPAAKPVAAAPVAETPVAETPAPTPEPEAMPVADPAPDPEHEMPNPDAPVATPAAPDAEQVMPDVESAEPAPAPAETA